MEANQTLDACGLNCPLPILRTKKTLNAMQPGDTLKVLTTDSGSLKDMASFCNQTGHVLVDSAQADGKFEFLIRKA